jgi:phage terminase small subunit
VPKRTPRQRAELRISRALSAKGERPGPRSRRAGVARGAVRARRDLFVEAYLSNGLNMTGAAVAAGYTQKSAGEAGRLLMRTAYVRERVERRLAEAQAAAEFSAQEVVNDLRDAMRYDRRELFKRDGSIKAMRELDAAGARLVEGVDVEVRAGGVTVEKVRVAKHVAVRDQAMRHFGLYAKDDAAPADPDEAARLVRERLGNFEAMTARRAEGAAGKPRKGDKP